MNPIDLDPKARINRCRECERSCRKLGVQYETHQDVTIIDRATRCPCGCKTAARALVRFCMVCEDEWSGGPVGPVPDGCAVGPVPDDYADGDGPVEDGDPCADCGRAVWFDSAAYIWYHVDPMASCFLCPGKSPRVQA